MSLSKQCHLLLIKLDNANLQYKICAGGTEEKQMKQHRGLLGAVRQMQWGKRTDFKHKSVPYFFLNN